MEVMQRPRTAEQVVAENTKEVLRHLEEDLEKAVEEVFLKQRSSTATTATTTVADRSLSGGSTLSTVSSISSETTSSGGGDYENKQQHQENRSIYLDTNDDKWKCRHCAWAYQNGFPQIDHNHSKPSDFDSRGTEKEAADDIQEAGSDVSNGKLVETSAAANDLPVLSEGTEIEAADAIQQVGSDVSNGKLVETSAAANNELKLELGLASDEEVVELEFEAAVESMHTRAHSKMLCPNCTHQITKVFIVRPKTTPPGELFGCLSCFSIFVSIGNRLNPFPLFGADSGLDQQQPIQDPAEAAGKKFDLLWPFRKERDPKDVKKQEEISSSPDTTARNQSDEVIEQERRFNVCWPFQKEEDDCQNALTSPLLPSPVTSNSTDNGVGQGDGANQPNNYENDEEISYLNGTTPDQLFGGKIQGMYESTGVPPVISDPDEDAIIDVGEHVDTVPFPGVDMPPETSPTSAVTPSGDARPWAATEPGSTRSVEIVKSVVFGGLMESMASLSVVSSAAASDSTTLNIAVLGLANLVGGLVVLAHNLKDLRYGDSGKADEVMEVRYEKELGSKQHFPLHAIVAVISYVIFGAIPPAVYAFTFRRTDDRDFKMLAVAAASLLCVFALAIGKAYARGERSFVAYFRTASYYISSLVMVAGISFAVGELTEKMVQELGWRLDPPAPVSGLHAVPEF